MPFAKYSEYLSLWKKATWVPFFLFSFLACLWEQSASVASTIILPNTHASSAFLLHSSRKNLKSDDSSSLSLNPNLLFTLTLLSPVLAGPYCYWLLLFHVNKTIRFCYHFSLKSVLGQLSHLVDWTVNLDYFGFGPFLGFPDLLKPNMNTSWFLTGCLKLSELIDGPWLIKR